MSGRISVVSISLALIALLFCSCTESKDSLLMSFFECSYSAEIEVKSDDGEYEATVTLAGLGTEPEGERSVRDGNIVYTYPETLSEISAVRKDGEISVNVCGIELKPSENIAAKYTSLLDVLDIRALDIKSTQSTVYEGRECIVLYTDSGAEVYIEREGSMPLMLKTEKLTVKFKSFTNL